MPKQDNKVGWKLSELEKKCRSLEEEVQVIRREDKTRDRRISDLELRNTMLADCVEQIGKKNKFICPFLYHIYRSQANWGE